jgi:lipopolysaccharide export system protein LptA
MRLSISRLRGVLIAGAALLVLVLVAYIGIGRYRSLMVYRRLLKKSGVTFTQDTNGFTYSQSVLDRKIFTLHAAKATQLGSGKWALHDADLMLFDKTGAPSDHIVGSEIEYDETSQVVRAQGVVDMDLLPPQGLANSGRAVTADAAGQPPAANKVPAQPIHVRTSGLVYLRKLGIAATEKEVDFSYGGMKCTAIGADFDSGENTLRLLSQVHMQGVAHGQPLYMTATHADMNRDTNIANLTQPTVTSNGRSASADRAVLNLRKDGSIEHLQGIDNVVLRSETQRITAARLDATLNQQTLPEKARLTGDIVMTGTDPARPMHGSAATVDALFDAHGVPTTVTAMGGAKFSVLDRKADVRGLNRSMEGATIVALFVPGGGRSSARLSEVHAIGSGHAGGDSIVPVKGAGVAEGRKNTQVWGDDLRLAFVADADGKSQAHKLDATGHTRLQQDAPLGEETASTGDTLTVAFAPEARAAGKIAATGGLGVASAVQTGHVTMNNRAASKVGSTEPGAISTGAADNASYDGAAQRLTLTGNAHLDGDNASMIAPTVVLDQVTQDTDARGGVQTTIVNAKAPGANAQAAAAPVTHILSATAHFVHATRLAEFYGTDAQPAKMWQDASQVQAATLLFDGIHHTFSARGLAPGALIRAVFAGNPAAPKPGAAPKPANILRVASPKMDYNDLQREATFTGGVTMDGSTGQVRGDRAVVFLTPAAKPSVASQTPAPTPSPFGGSGGQIDRVVVSGSVQMDQPGRHGTGDQILYTAADGRYILTGTPATPPCVVDTQQGTVTGATLLFSDSGSTIVVAGDAGAAKTPGGRVRSEISVKPKAEERQ